MLCFIFLLKPLSPFPLSFSLSFAVLSLPVTSGQLENEDAKVRVHLLSRNVILCNDELKMLHFSSHFQREKSPSDPRNPV